MRSCSVPRLTASGVAKVRAATAGCSAMNLRRRREASRLSLGISLAALVLGPGMVAAQALPDPAAFPYDSALFTVLAMEPGPGQLDSLAAYESRVRYHVGDTLSVVAEDPSIHPLLRANAALLIGRRRDVRHFIVLKPLLDADDPRIRLAVVAAAQEFLPVMTDESLSVLRAALQDPESAVQVRALEAIGDRDAAALRSYLAGTPPTQLAAVAEGLLMAAEQRGAPLEPAADGSLGKTGPGDHRLVYRRRQVWPGSDLSAGTLELVMPDGRTIVLGDSVEVARNVVPAFFSADGEHIVFEESRTIRVHHTASGETEIVGSGLAPRPLPFTEEFVFAVPLEQSTTEVRGQTRTTYALRTSPFAAPTDDREPFGEVTVVSSYGVTGGASPVRWMHVVEDGGRLSLQGENVELAPLPDPFGGTEP